MGARPRARLWLTFLLALGCGNTTSPPPPPCGTTGAGCAALGDCCSGVCAFGFCACTAQPFAPCSTSMDCCTGSCDQSGHCSSISCGWQGQACASSQNCCAENYCALGTCHTGACGNSGSPCASASECCQGARRFTCEAQQCTCRKLGASCTDDPDCCDSLGCNGGVCKTLPGTLPERALCYDDADCAGGGCQRSTGSNDAGYCCSTQGKSCGIFSACCGTLTCNDAAQQSVLVCSACLDWSNSGSAAPGSTRCIDSRQCCAASGLSCEPGSGRCCKRGGYSCGGGQECCSELDCRTQGIGSGAPQCCAKFGGNCGSGGAGCCGRMLCDLDPDGGQSCRQERGGACTSTSQCSSPDDCRAGACCGHSGACTQPSDCCSGVCSNGGCVKAPAYGSCVTDTDCASVAFPNSSPACGANGVLDAGVCCPLPGDACTQGQATCCEGTNLCQPQAADAGTTAVCCRPSQASCFAGSQCCTGLCRQNACCAATKMACGTAAECCFGYAAAQLCASNVCCLAVGDFANGDATLCCSTRVNASGFCRN